MSKNVKIVICQNSVFCKKKIIRMTNVKSFRFLRSKLFQNHGKPRENQLQLLKACIMYRGNPTLQMITFVVHLIRRSPHDYWDVISMTLATSHVAYNSKDLDHTTMRSEYLQFTSTNTFLYYLVPFLVKKMMINWKMSTYFIWVSFFSVQTLLSFNLYCYKKSP